MRKVTNKMWGVRYANSTRKRIVETSREARRKKRGRREEDDDREEIDDWLDSWLVNGEDTAENEDDFEAETGTDSDEQEI